MRGALRVNKKTVFVYRDGFRRRRLVTSLLDPDRFPASELARLYHLRWDIETFYREFKHTLRATSWHGHTPNSFHQELLMHMIALCLIRLAMLEASRLIQISVGQISLPGPSPRPACSLSCYCPWRGRCSGLPSGKGLCIASCPGV